MDQKNSAFDTIRGLRAIRPRQIDQNELAGDERRAFAREWINEEPLTALTTLPLAIPADYLARKLGFMRGRSEPTLDQMTSGFKGYIEGLRNLVSPK